MSNVSEGFEGLTSNLAQGQARADRLAFLTGNLWDERGRATILALPEARALLSFSLKKASDDAATLGIELNDTRWVGVVTLLHHAGENLGGMQASDARAVSGLLGGLQYRIRQLRDKRASAEVKVRLS